MSSRYITATPPAMSTRVPEIKRVFKGLLDSIAICDERNGTNTPSTTLLLIMAAARQLGVQPVDLVNNDEDDD